MPVFTYRARTVGGENQSGEITATTEADVVGQLRRRRLVVVSVKEKPKDIKFSFGGRVKTKDLVLFTRQFATMINAGLPLVQSLDILATQQPNKRAAEKIRAVLSDVESGSTLADAMRRHRDFFSEIYVNMVAAGEAGGILDVILLRLAEYLEASEKLRRKVKGAMFYPATVMGFSGLAIAVLLIFVIPTFAGFFETAGVPLPLPTRIVMGLSGFLISWWWAVAAVLAGIGWLFRAYRKTPAGKLTTDRLMLRIPILGQVLRKAAIARFSRTLGTLVQSGVPILDGLEITARTAGNRVVEDAVMKSRASIAGGETIAEPLKRSAVFPPMVVQMINVGEQTGGLDDMLSKIADFYDEEVDAAVGALTSIIEPVMIVFLGAIVGGMVIAMYLPIFDIIKTVE
ncbi:MAG TPA: type II secretion system F family protein [Gemmatimonadota bacterium]|jgi:type IV pilus assembly protein PilC|nr:type II secretion system F family protein [Gemmatimonadota bacterium]